MDMLGEKLLGMAGIRRARMDSKEQRQAMRQSDRYSPIPAIPSDIGYAAGKQTGGSHRTGVMDHATSNPFVIVGMGLTTYALCGMIRRSVMGDKQGTQKYMQYRIMAQFFTVTAMVAGVALMGTFYGAEDTPKPAAATVETSAPVVVQKH
uniref:HIG1 domain-containing protein n=1 Tax=Panagrellus redivivus TaxID=6233 RepID=A0A7E4VS04_PANRE